MKRKFAGLFGPLSLRKSLLALILIFTASGIVTTAAHAATAPVNVWWPANNASLEGVQPFKAVVDGKSLGDYSMFWSVDGGGLVKMNDSQADYPHKEAMVDLGGWNWSSTGTYSVSFIAQDLSGNEIAKTNVTIKHGSIIPAAPAPAPAPTAQPNPLTNPTAPAPTVSQTATAAPAETARLAIRVWSPAAGSNLTGIQPIKAVLGSNLGSYKMYWSVDGGGQTEMYDSYVSAPHKENLIDFTNWTWKGNNIYVINLAAKDNQGKIIATTDIPVYVNAKQAQTAPIAAPTPVPIVTTTAPAPTTATTIATTPIITASGSKLYVDPNNPALAQANTWRASRPTDAAIMDKIGAQSTGIWLGGWNANVASDVQSAMSKAANQGSIPTFVAYNIPGRDCGSYSAGGASNASEYLSWIRNVSTGLGSGKAILVLEPDGLASIDCLSDSQKTERYSMLSQAVDIFKANNPGTKVYVDAGHSGWIGESEMANRLAKAGVARSAGFALNVSNFSTTGDNANYGTNVSKLAGNAHFVIDTSRNGNGSNGEWCNPSGRALGQAPTLSTGNALIDAFLWVKKPGESDGACNGGPSAGTWWPEYALDLAKRAGY
ncbi:glycoside hydrolase family 6 protein [Candidatus Parcubacteria bacterium]|nr:glycoside hydrolase family 6 protein [Candidatus Parcubacteria bacterium]